MSRVQSPSPTPISHHITVLVRSLFLGAFLLQPFIEQAAGFQFGIARGLAAEFVSIFCEKDFSQIKIGKVGESFVEFVELGEVELVGFRFCSFFLFHSASDPFPIRPVDEAAGIILRRFV
jgi:hypothetical protein